LFNSDDCLNNILNNVQLTRLRNSSGVFIYKGSNHVHVHTICNCLAINEHRLLFNFQRLEVASV